MTIREQLRRALTNVLSNATNYPEKVQTRILGQNMGPLTERVTDAALTVLSEQRVTGETSDGHHTFDELYDYRMLYNAHAAHGWLAAGIPVVKSWRHSDGELCFGGGWFIVTATLPTGQVSNHYRAEHWGLFTVPAVDLPPAYDGHTPADVANRLRVAAQFEQAHTPTSDEREASRRAWGDFEQAEAKPKQNDPNDFANTPTADERSPRQPRTSSVSTANSDR